MSGGKRRQPVARLSRASDLSRPSVCHGVEWDRVTRIAFNSYFHIWLACSTLSPVTSLDPSRLTPQPTAPANIQSRQRHFTRAAPATPHSSYGPMHTQIASFGARRSSPVRHRTAAREWRFEWRAGTRQDGNELTLTQRANVSSSTHPSLATISANLRVSLLMFSPNALPTSLRFSSPGWVGQSDANQARSCN